MTGRCTWGFGCEHTLSSHCTTATQRLHVRQASYVETPESVQFVCKNAQIWRKLNPDWLKTDIVLMQNPHIPCRQKHWTQSPFTPTDIWRFYLQSERVQSPFTPRTLQQSQEIISSSSDLQRCGHTALTEVQHIEKRLLRPSCRFINLGFIPLPQNNRINIGKRGTPGKIKQSDLLIFLNLNSTKSV